MKKISLYSILFVLIAASIQACGPSEEERRAAEQARLDSLKQAEQQRIEALMQAREDSLAKVQKTEMEESGGEERSDDAKPAPASGDFAEDGSYAVQVGAWRSEVKANRFIRNWADRNYPSAYVVQTGNEETGDIWFRVRVGFFANEADAEQLGRELAEELDTGYWVTKAR